MKLLIMSYDLYKNSVILDTRVSGLTIYVGNLLEYWQRSYPNISFSFIRSTKTGKENTSPIVVKGINVYNMNTSLDSAIDQVQEDHVIRDVTNELNPFYDKRAKRLAEVVNREKPDLLNVHNTRAACTVIWAEKKGYMSHTPTVATLHDLFDEPLEFISRNQRYFDRFVAISKSVYERAKSYEILADSLRLIPNGMDIQSFMDLLEGTQKVKNHFDFLPDKEKSFLVLMPSRRVPHKGHRVAILSLNLIERIIGKKTYLLFTGAGISGGNRTSQQYELELRREVRERGLDSQVIFIDELTREELAALYQQVDVVITPSLEEEGFCYSNLEAMLSRVPVITSRIGGPLDYIVDGKNGFFVSSGSAPELADALINLSRNPVTDEFLDNAAEKASTFTIGKMAEAYLDLFNEIIDDDIHSD